MIAADIIGTRFEVLEGSQLYSKPEGETFDDIAGKENKIGM